MEEREISLVDLLAEILLHWRMFIAWMAVGAVLLGAFSYMRSGNAIQQQQTETKRTEQAPEEWLTEEEIRNAAYVATYEKTYLSKEAYLAQSPLMKMDANHIYMGEAIIAVEARDRQVGCDIEKVYEEIGGGSALISKIAEEFGIETAGVGEMILLSGLTEGNNIPQEAEGTNSFKIVVMDSEKDRCQAILEEVIVFLEERQLDIENILDEHKLVIIDKSFGEVSNTAVAEKQQRVLNDIASMKKTLLDEKDKLSDVELQYYDLLVSDEKAEEKSAPETASVPGISIKYVILGMAMAVFLYAFILLMSYIFTAKVRSTDNLQELYNIPQLGMIPANKKHKKIFDFVDKWILSLRNHNKRQFAPEEALGLASVAIKMSAGKESLSEICVVGCGLKERSLDVCEKIKAQLREENIHVNILNNVLYDAQAMGELEKEKGAVLVEGVGSTLYQEITEELEILNRQGIRVLGGILVE